MYFYSNHHPTPHIHFHHESPGHDDDIDKVYKRCFFIKSLRLIVFSEKSIQEILKNGFISSWMGFIYNGSNSKK